MTVGKLSAYFGETGRQCPGSSTESYPSGCKKNELYISTDLHLDKFDDFESLGRGLKDPITDVSCKIQIVFDDTPFLSSLFLFLLMRGLQVGVSEAPKDQPDGTTSLLFVVEPRSHSTTGEPVYST